MAPHSDSPEQQREPAFEPRGTLIFVLLMLLGYIAYWFYVWSIVVFERA